MRGRTHAVCGVITMAAITAATANSLNIGAYHLMPAVGLVLAGPGSYGPDIDHHATSLGHKHPFISRHLTHRGITHTLLVPAILVGIIYLCFTYNVTIIPDLLFGYLVGWIVHIIADMFNTTGVPILWPLTNKKISLGPFVTGTWHENLFIILWISANSAFVLWRLGFI